jgi:hypothetical protein
MFITLWQLRSCFSEAPSLTRGRVCLLYMLLALASIVFLGLESLWIRDDILLSQIWDFPFRRLLRLAGSRWRYSNPPPQGLLKLDITIVALYSLRTDHAQKTRFYFCVRNITPSTSHATPNQYCWSVTSCACVEVCLPSRNLEMDYVTPLFHCWYMYYLEMADSVAQPFLHGAITPPYTREGRCRMIRVLCIYSDLNRLLYRVRLLDKNINSLKHGDYYI